MIESQVDGAGLRHSRCWILLLTAVLSFVVYGWSIKLPFIADDYLQIKLAEQYGSPSGWAALLSDPLYRCRATSLVLTWLTVPWAGMDPLWYNLTSIFLHVLNAWMVFALGAWRRIGWKISGAAACFFAIHEGHQEAVAWYSALPELLVVFFVLVCVLFWILRYEKPERARIFYLGSLIAFVAALASKESAVAATGLLALVSLREQDDWKRIARLLIPFAILSCLYFVADYAGRSQNQHYSDGTFALTAPFWLTLPRSMARMFWFWGLISLAALWIWRSRFRLALVGTALGWVVVALSPYSFLTYMPVVPSRHTYMAAVGLSLIVAAAFVALQEQHKTARWIPATVALLVLLHNCSYLWIRKQRQYLERAEPTELLVENLRGRQGEVDVYCFPYASEAAELAVRMRIGGHVRLRILPMGRPLLLPDGAINLCETPLARAAMRGAESRPKLAVTSGSE